MNDIRHRTKCTMEEYLRDICTTPEEYRKSLPIPNIDILAHMNMGNYELWKACYKRYKIDTVDTIPSTLATDHTNRVTAITTMIVADAISRNYYRSSDSTSSNKIRDLSYMYEFIHEYLVKETASRDDVLVGCVYDFEKALAPVSGSMLVEDMPTYLYYYDDMTYLLVDEAFSACMSFGIYNKTGIMMLIDMSLSIAIGGATTTHPLSIYRYVRRQMRKRRNEYIDGLY